MCDQTHLAIIKLQNPSERAKKQVSQQTNNILHVRLHAIQICSAPCFTLEQIVPILQGWESPILNEIHNHKKKTIFTKECLWSMNMCSPSRSCFGLLDRAEPNWKCRSSKVQLLTELEEPNQNSQNKLLREQPTPSTAPSINSEFAINSSEATPTLQPTPPTSNQFMWDLRGPEQNKINWLL